MIIAALNQEGKLFSFAAYTQLISPLSRGLNVASTPLRGLLHWGYASVGWSSSWGLQRQTPNRIRNQTGHPLLYLSRASPMHAGMQESLKEFRFYPDQTGPPSKLTIFATSG